LNHARKLFIMTLTDTVFVDTHCHLDFDTFDADRDEVVERAVAAGVTRIIVPAVDLDSCRAVLALAERYAAVYAAVGIHPNSSAGWEDAWLDTLRELAAYPKVVAIGEIGLDYYWDKSPPAVQHRALAAQLELAAELGKPVILHNREADADLLRLLAESPVHGRANPGVFHSFSTTWETAQAALDHGYYIGFTGPLTYKNADALRRVAAQTPLDRLLLETDAPFLPPQKHRGRRNEPAYLPLIADRMAALHNVSVELLAGHTSDNAARLFEGTERFTEQFRRSEGGRDLGIRG
jgi:TatD DNase family protein